MFSTEKNSKFISPPFKVLLVTGLILSHSLHTCLLYLLVYLRSPSHNCLAQGTTAAVINNPQVSVGYHNQGYFPLMSECDGRGAEFCPTHSGSQALSSGDITILKSQSAWLSCKRRREYKGPSRRIYGKPRNSAHWLHSVVQSSVTWANCTARESGKYSPSEYPREKWHCFVEYITLSPAHMPHFPYL